MKIATIIFALLVAVAPVFAQNMDQDTVYRYSSQKANGKVKLDYQGDAKSSDYVLTETRYNKITGAAEDYGFHFSPKDLEATLAQLQEQRTSAVNSLAEIDKKIDEIILLQADIAKVAKE